MKLPSDIGHWNWTLDIEIGHSPLKLDIQLWQSVILKPKVMLTFIWMHRLLFNNNKDKYLNCYLFCNLLICEGWIYWYNLSPLRGGEIGQHVIIFLLSAVFCSLHLRNTFKCLVENRLCTIWSNISRVAQNSDSVTTWVIRFSEGLRSVNKYLHGF